MALACRRVVQAVRLVPKVWFVKREFGVFPPRALALVGAAMMPIALATKSAVVTVVSIRALVKPATTTVIAVKI